MIRSSFVVLIVLGFVLSAVPVFSAPNMQDGLWEITTTTDIPGMPAGMSKPVKQKSCLTKSDAVPKQKDSDCKVTSSKISGNTVAWDVSCKNGGVVSEGMVIYSGDKFDGTSITTVNQGGQTMKIKSRMDGKRIGPCK
ncbi:MAG: DUF3617 domain-containing protein [Nitrospiraceae bacterium]|nr:DUF3617 domain-containing protein [Nitrospiraceae bacterium]